MRGTTCSVLVFLVSTLAAAQAAMPIIASEGQWDLRQSDEQSAGKPTCLLTPKTPSRIQVTGQRLDVTGLPKNSIFNFQYRIDDQPVSNAMIPSAEMQKAGAVSLEGDAFDSLLKGQTFSIRILDKWHEAITEEISLVGLGALYRKMLDTCR